MSDQQGFIGFAGVPFTVLAPGGGMVYRGWEQEDDEAIFRIYDSNITVVQDLGYGLASWTATLAFDGLAGYRALQARRKTTGVLTLYAGYTNASGIAYHDLGIDYEDLPETTLVRLSAPRIEVGHDWVEAEAVFRRAMNPETGGLT